MSAATASLSRDEMAELAPAGRGLFSIEGMWCPSCAAATERVVARVPGVTRARVSFATGSALVDWDPDRIDLPGLLHAVERLGYAIGPPRAPEETVAAIDGELGRLGLRLAVAAFFGMWVMVLAIMRYVEPTALGNTPVGHTLSIIAMGLVTPVVGFSAAPFFLAGWRTLRAGIPGMDALVSIGVIGAGVLSVTELIQGGAHVYADTMVMLIVLLSIGRMVEMRTVRRAATAIGALEREVPERAFPVSGNGPVDAASIAVGDRVQVAAGARVPLDGELVEGATRVDASLLTGESTPVSIAPGGTLHAGTINLDAPVTVVVTAAVGDRRIDRILGRMVEMQGNRSEITRLADGLARVLVPGALALAAGVAVTGTAFGLGFEESLLRALSVVVIACPCALSIAVPVTFLSFAERAMGRGVLFRSPATMEQAGQLRHLLIDKTGTLTRGEPSVVETVTADGVDEAELQALAAQAEAGIDHPVARALQDPAQGPDSGIHRRREGRGVTITLPDGDEVRVGSRRWLTEAGVDLPARATEHSDRSRAATLIHVTRNGEWLGRFALGDPLRPAAAETVRSLRARGFRVAMVTGDGPEPAHRVAADVGLAGDAVVAGCRPEEKADRVLAAQAEAPTAFIGDGINDSVAMAAADVGVAIDGASHAATSSAGLVVARGGLPALASALALARSARGRMRQNLGLALVYNGLAIPLAVAGVIPPSAAALAMLASSLSVMANAARPG
ncbi:heavy metal translocating P-type ATPase [Spiribacter vilamensis]|uniref:Cu+-exporting ATPase n=1 Tax=Spiribacter vilamensis TaxID=531306 RepID=A0A4Q8D2T7_9GAMM|nr:cation-translocating P-type ATPase [Spiribacter vilamensis]RZU99741.1 Cu+-exporting ATPase [Spiribacter vilamensis]TVO61314.1 cation-translocating P-type ATPase [Spiribacter vilamensis]